MKAEREDAAGNGDDRSPKSHKNGETHEQPAEEDTGLIVNQAHQEAARIITEAKDKAKYLAGEAGGRDTAVPRHLKGLAKSGKFTEHSYEQLDNLFVQTRRCLAKIAQYDQPTIDELTNLLAQLEYWVESLVVDSLKLKSLERWLQGTTELAKQLQAELNKK